MHTEFVRERAQPGQLCIGADSHTSSAGAVGCLSIGLGTADILMTLCLGETWFKIPDSVRIELTGRPAFGISGKDVTLHILKEFKRNTVAAERLVEFGGEGVQHLSIDARFAICNMCAEFGAITGVFVPDRITEEYIRHRRNKTYCDGSLYFKPDEGAKYVATHSIDLSAVEQSIAMYPKPDDVRPISEETGMTLDGVFIGACTTTEEELILAGLVLKVGLARGLPLAKGKRHYVPGSLPIVEKLRKLGLLRVYEDAGFSRGPPGCSLCVGLSVEKALEGETWLTSQNRNFENRLGKGSFGHLASAMACAASAFSMKITNPADFIDELDVAFFNEYKGLEQRDPTKKVQYVEPKLPSASSLNLATTGEPPADTIQDDVLENISSRIVRLGDFIDTDAMAPGSTLTVCKTDEDFGEHVLKNTHPDFRAKVKGGQQVVVAGVAFGCGSSREVAVSAMKGVGVKAVIARSFAFIYARNQPSRGLLGIVVDDDDFFEAAQEGVDIEINVAERRIALGHGESRRSFPFVLSDMEYKLTANKGIAEAYNRFGKGLWQKMMVASGGILPDSVSVQQSKPVADERLSW